MSAESRFKKERPYAQAVINSARTISSEPMMPDAARTGGLFAIAYALLDVSEAIRDHTRETREGGDR